MQDMNNSLNYKNYYFLTNYYNLYFSLLVMVNLVFIRIHFAPKYQGCEPI